MLNLINTPSDLKNLPPARLKVLAQEIREVMVDTVATNGGHLAANLGVVELTLALHYVYELPKDKIVWDVGHQSYVHKILTGRQSQLATLRQYKGLSGFPKTEESLFDSFNTGHSSTSISAAVGLAVARDTRQESHSVIAVIGDGALTGGMAFEALNHAGHLNQNMTVVLNDNAMSISPNVGALSGYLRKLRMDPAYFRNKEEVQQALRRIPGIGHNLVRVAGRVKDVVKFMVVPGLFFEELGFTYLGPIDGHNIEDLIVVMQKARYLKGPVLIHVMTQKGKGYTPAMKNPGRFHGIGPFDVTTGHAMNSGAKTYSQVFGEFMVRKAGEDKDVVAITAAMTNGTGLDDFAAVYPERLFDVGICEQHAVTMAAGMAMGGLKPVVAVYSTFMQRAFDQAVHDVALQNLPVIFALDRAGLVGEDGPTHHGVFDLSYMRMMPNMIVMAPSNEDQLNDMLESAFLYNAPTVIRYPRGGDQGKEIKKNPAFIPQGQGVLLREGEQILLVAIGKMVETALETALVMAELNINAAVIDARFAKPIDRELINEWANRCGKVITMEDNTIVGGFGEGVMEILSNCTPPKEVMTMGIPDRFIEHGRTELLFEDIGLTPETITEKALLRWPDLKKRRMMRSV